MGMAARITLPLSIFRASCVCQSDASPPQVLYEKYNSLLVLNRDDRQYAWSELWHSVALT